MTIEVAAPGPGAQATSDVDDKDLNKIARWVAEIELYERETRDWCTQSDKIIKRYKDDRKSPEEENKRRFNVLWANIQTTLPALYAKNPKPDIQRRFKDDDPIGRVTSSVLERSVSYFVDTDFFAGTIRGSVLDYLLPGRGVVWIRYEPTIETQEVEVTDDVEEGQANAAPEKIAYEEVIPDYVNREDFGHNICRTWDEVWCGWRIVYMTRRALVKRFGEEIGNKPPLDHQNRDGDGKNVDDGVGKSVIYELWDKERKCAVWFHKTIPDALDLREDPLKLQDFFPFPKPMLTNLANDSLIPVPDYKEYQDQADELDSLTGRIASIQRSLKVAGVYDASAPALKRLLGEGMENELVPVESWAVFAEKGGLKNAFELLPLKDIVTALNELYQVRSQVKNDLYEITGMSDVVRGVSDPDETASAQKIKSNFATMRIGDRQREVQRFVRAIIRIMVDVMCNHFQDETIKKISGIRLFTAQEKQVVQQTIAQYQQMAQQAQAAQQPPPPPPKPPNGLTQDQVEQMMDEPTWEDVFGLLRDNALRCFRIDIETNSTIKADEEADKASRVEFLKAIGEYMAQALPAGQQTPELVPFLMQGLMFLARGFPVGKELEGALHVAIAKLEKLAANPQPKPDPDMAKVQAEAQAKTQQLQQEMQLGQMKLESEEKIAMQRNELEAGRDQARIEAEAQRDTLKAQQEGKLALQEAYIKAATAVEVALVTAGKASGTDFVARAEALEHSGAPIAADGATPQPQPQRAAPSMDAHRVIAAQKTSDQASVQRHREMLDALGKMHQSHQQSANAIAYSHAQASQQANENHKQMLRAMTGEKEVVRDKSGRAVGVRHKMSAVQ